MTKLVLLIFVLALELFFDGLLTVNGEEFTVDAKRREGEKKYSPLWFGPRIGRRKRNPSENIFKTLDRDEMETLARALKNPYTLAALNNNDKRQMDFTPRLGRESAEDEELDYDDIIRHRSLTPRLGRRLPLYSTSPRLGRENDISLQ